MFGIKYQRDIHGFLLHGIGRLASQHMQNMAGDSIILTCAIDSFAGLAETIPVAHNRGKNG